MDTYADYQELNANEKEDRDYQITIRRAELRVAVLAIHGGGIEPGTAEIADGVAGGDYSFYSFKGIKSSRNRVLHLTANRFDEPRGIALVSQADTVVAIHGCQEALSAVYIGGRDSGLGGRIQDSLSRAGFTARQSRRAGLRGIHRHNICNRGRSGRGVQLEISAGLRRELFDPLTHRSVRRKTARYSFFVDLLRGVLATRAAEGASV